MCEVVSKNVKLYFRCFGFKSYIINPILHGEFDLSISHEGVKYTPI